MMIFIGFKEVKRMTYTSEDVEKEAKRIVGLYKLDKDMTIESVDGGKKMGIFKGKVVDNKSNENVAELDDLRIEALPDGKFAMWKMREYSGAPANIKVNPGE